MDWFRLYGDMPGDPKWRMLGTAARLISMIAHEQGEHRGTCYPNWRQVEVDSALTSSEFIQAFDELCKCGVVSDTFPSILVGLTERWPLAPVFGPIESARPCAAVWKKIRTRIFERDNYICQYCSARGVRLECDHIVPVSRGGSSEDDNLVTACFPCNRSKRDKLLSEWRTA